MVYIRNYIKALECELQRVDLCWAHDCVHVDRRNVIAGEQDGLDEGI